MTIARRATARRSTARLVALLGSLLALAPFARAQDALPAPTLPTENIIPGLPTLDLWGDFPRVDLATPSPALRWPARLPAPDGRPGQIVPVEGAILKPQIFRTGSPPVPMRLADHVDARRLLGHAFPDDARVLDEGPGALMVAIERPEPGAMIPRRRRNDAAATFRFVSAQHDAHGVIRPERTWFAYFEPVDGAPTRAIVLLMPGMFGTPSGLLDRVTNDLRGRGVAVLRMITQPSRFTEQLTIPLNPGADPAELDAAARDVAALYDTRAAECAYAAHAALDHVQATFPAAAGKPVLAVGFSAGAITLPVVLAKDPARFAGAVLVGAGCHWWLMTELSNYRDMIDAVEFRWSREPDASVLARVRDGYLRASVLDSFHVAPMVARVPAYYVQGARDLAVPAPLGDVLWERLGRPERDLIEGGHEVLFLQLAQRLERIYTWMDARLPTP